MGKVKIKKKETRIDMTAMSDVTVLLLTFFMLTSTFLQEEPAQVITPPSVSEDKVPIERVATVLVSSRIDKNKETQPVVYMELLGTADSTLMSSEKLRVAVLDKFTEKYNSVYSANLSFTPAEKAVFAKLTAFGVPAKELKNLLDPNMKDEDRLKMQKESEGIGIEWSTGKNDTKETEFQIWVQAIELAYNDWYHDDKKDDDEKKEAINNAKKEILSDLKAGKGIAIKADQGTPYSVTELVFNNLAMIHKNKFTLVTSLKTGGN